MKMSTNLRILAKHLNHAAEEMELLECGKDVCAETPTKPVDNKDCIDNIPVPPVIKEIENGKEESSKSTSEESSKKTSGKKASSKKACDEKVVDAKAVAEVVPPLAPVNVPAKRTLTLEIVRGECRKVLDLKGRKALEDILVKYNALKTSDLKQENFENVMKDCSEALGDSHEF